MVRDYSSYTTLPHFNQLVKVPSLKRRTGVLVPVLKYMGSSNSKFIIMSIMVKPLPKLLEQSLEVVTKNVFATRALVRIVTDATLKLNGFALIQFLEGADITMHGTGSKMVCSEHSRLVFRLIHQINPRGDQQTITFTISELKLLRLWLETRLTHCEEERQKEIENPPKEPKFNPDSYIGMKLLLLDLRELMLGEIVPPPVEL